MNRLTDMLFIGPNGLAFVAIILPCPTMRRSHLAVTFNVEGHDDSEAQFQQCLFYSEQKIQLYHLRTGVRLCGPRVTFYRKTEVT